MKERLGFVSNSSSCSFLIIGTRDSEIINELMKKDKPKVDNYWGGVCNGKVVNYYGGEIAYPHNETKSPYCEPPDYAGIEVSDADLRHVTVEQRAMEISDLIFAKLKVRVPASKLTLIFGTVSSE